MATKHVSPIVLRTSFEACVGEPLEFVLVTDLSRKGTIVGYQTDDFRIKHTLEGIIRNSISECVGKPTYLYLTDKPLVGMDPSNPATWHSFTRSPGTIYGWNPNTQMFAAHDDVTRPLIVGAPIGPTQQIAGYKFQQIVPPFVAGETGMVQGTCRWHGNPSGEYRVIQLYDAVQAAPTPETWGLLHVERTGGVAQDSAGNTWMSTNALYDPYYGAYLSPAVTQIMFDPCTGWDGMVSQHPGHSPTIETYPHLLEGLPPIRGMVDDGLGGSQGSYKQFAFEANANRMVQVVFGMVPPFPPSRQIRIVVYENGTSNNRGIIVFNIDTGEVTLLGAAPFPYHRVKYLGQRAGGERLFQIHFDMQHGASSTTATRLYFYPSSVNAEPATMVLYVVNVSSQRWWYEPIPDVSTRPADGLWEILPPGTFEAEGGQAAGTFLSGLGQHQRHEIVAPTGNPAYASVGFADNIAYGSVAAAGAERWNVYDGVNPNLALHADDDVKFPTRDRIGCSEWEGSGVNASLVGPGRAVVTEAGAYQGAFQVDTNVGLYISRNPTYMPRTIRSAAFWPKRLSTYKTTWFEDSFGPASFIYPAGQARPPEMLSATLTPDYSSLRVEVTTDEDCSLSFTLAGVTPVVDAGPSRSFTLDITGLTPNQLYAWTGVLTSSYSGQTRTETGVVRIVPAVRMYHTYNVSVGQSTTHYVSLPAGAPVGEGNMALVAVNCSRPAALSAPPELELVGNLDVDGAQFAIYKGLPQRGGWELSHPQGTARFISCTIVGAGAQDVVELTPGGVISGTGDPATLTGQSASGGWVAAIVAIGHQALQGNVNQQANWSLPGVPDGALTQVCYHNSRGAGGGASDESLGAIVNRASHTGDVGTCTWTNLSVQRDWAGFFVEFIRL